MLTMLNKHITDKKEDAGVSPVIGVILMVAVTLVLAAVISVALLGATDRVGDPVPTATFDMEYDSGTVTLEHESGASIDKSSLSVLVGGDEVDENVTYSDTDSDSITVGNTMEFAANSGDEVKLLFTSGDSSYPLAEYTVE